MTRCVPHAIADAGLRARKRQRGFHLSGGRAGGHLRLAGPEQVLLLLNHQGRLPEDLLRRLIQRSECVFDHLAFLLVLGDPGGRALRVDRPYIGARALLLLLNIVIISDVLNAHQVVLQRQNPGRPRLFDLGCLLVGLRLVFPVCYLLEIKRGLRLLVQTHLYYI